jgi:hypothetical protein
MTPPTTGMRISSHHGIRLSAGEEKAVEKRP